MSKKDGRKGSARERAEASVAAQMDTAGLLAEGLRRHQAGRISEAAGLYGRVLAVSPEHADALHLLGVARLQMGNPEEAAGLIERAAAIKPDDAGFLNNLGEAYRALGRLSEAIDCYRRAITRKPGDAAPHNNLGNALVGQGRVDDAVASYRRSLEIQPDDPETLSNLGEALMELGRLGEAVQCLDRATSLNPRDPVTLTRLGNAYKANGDMTQAILHFRRALDIAHADPVALNNLGNALGEAGRHTEAIACFSRIIDVDSGNVSAYNNLAGALDKSGRPEKAIAMFERAIAIDPKFAEAHNNLANLRYRLGRMDESLAGFRRSLSLDPDNAEAHKNYSHALLYTGNFEEGWREYQWRWKCWDFKAKGRHETLTPWSGEPVDGKTLLVWGEQGIGDEVGFASMVPDLIKRGARVLLECTPRLAPLFSRSFKGADVFAKTTSPSPRVDRGDIDFHVPSGNLGRWLRPSLQSFPRLDAYLVADDVRRSLLRKKYLKERDGLLVGIAWVSKNPEVGEIKSMSLEDLAPLGRVPGVTLVDLQYGDTEAERKAFEKDTGLPILHDPTVDQMQDLDAFAAQLAALDLVVSVSNTTVHMAGALGVPTWIMLPTMPMWRWMADTETSPWYASVRLFRQPRSGDWPGIVGRIQDELKGLARRS